MTAEIALAAASLIGAAYLGYPMLLWACAHVAGGDRSAPECDDADLPAITLLVVAHNEQTTIGARLENALAANYPRDRYHIDVASDGSTDATAAIVRSFAPYGVTLHDFVERRGKASVLRD